MRIKMPAVRIAQADSEGLEVNTGHQDILTCGSCQKPFALSDIVRFIQHKIISCNKENFSGGHCFPPTDRERDRDSDDGLPLSVVNTRRPSISAPISAKKAMGRVHTPPPASPRLPAPADLCVDGAASSTPKRRASSSPLTSSSMEEGEDVKPNIKQERMDTSSSPEETSQKKSRTEVADAESNTTHSEPSNYVCSTCKARLHSAWRLVQHVQHAHGVKIYVESSLSGNNTSGSHVSMAGSGKASNNNSSSSSCSTSSGCSSGPAVPPPNLRHHLLPPPDLHHSFGVGGLLRLPLPTSLPPLGHGPVPPAPLFARPEHHFRMEQLVSEQFRHHGLNLAAAAAAAVAAGTVPPPHSPFPSPADRGPPTGGVPSAGSLPGRNDRANVNVNANQPLSLEPQLDFYSQRLRQLAGTTSPGAATASSPSPRKHSPPFASPSPSQQLPITSVTNSASATTLASNNNNNNSSSSSSNNNNNNNNTSGSGAGSRPQSLSPPAKLETSAPLTPQAITSTPRSASTPPSKPASPRNSAAEPIHACDYCGKKFRFQSNLAIHRRAHTGERPYKCTVCDHSCTQSSKLKRHMRMHRSSEDRASNAGSVETLDGEDSEDDDDELEEEEEEEDELENEDDEEEAEDLSIPASQNTPVSENGGNNNTTNKLCQSASLVGELMDKFGLSNIAQYSEAYKQALQESNSALSSMQKDRDNNNSSKTLPGGLAGVGPPLRIRDEFVKGLIPTVPPPQPMPLFAPFGDPFETSKRLKLDLERGDWWLPKLEAKMAANAGGVGAGPSALLGGGPLLKKESRRNDTCEFCGKVFKNCSNLTVHRRSHTGEKPYKCELCSYACAQSSKLTRHMKTHGRLGKDVYRCRFCEMPFSVPSTLEKHMRKCVVNQGKGHLLPPLPVLCADSEDSSASVPSKDAAT